LTLKQTYKLGSSCVLGLGLGFQFLKVLGRLGSWQIDCEFRKSEV
jgi:hypothetical protein